MKIFLLGVLGENADKEIEALKNIKDIDFSGVQTYNGRNWSYCVNCQTFSTAPSYPIWKDDKKELGLIVHGNPIIRESTLDMLISDSENVFKHILNISSTPRDIVSHFINGNFVGCILEPLKGEFTIFNNFFGQLPLYYTLSKNKLYFSTDLYLLCRHPAISVDWNLSAIDEYLTFGKIVSGRTIIKGIFALMPASMLVFNTKNYTIINKHYDTFPPELRQYKPFDVAVEEVLTFWKKAINRLYSNKATFCLSLTGGSDSRLIFLEWPDKMRLLTETAGGENFSDFIKARALLKRIGNIHLHARENRHEDKIVEGVIEYFKEFDNPLTAYAYNYFHIKWKASRGATFRLTGCNGELLGGENLYRSRAPSYILWETFLPLKYNKLNKNDIKRKLQLFKVVYYADYVGDLKFLLKDDLKDKDLNEEEIIHLWDKFVGEISSEEVYLERVRTTMLSQICYESIGILGREDFELLFPYCDIELVKTVAKLPPRYRELRRLEIALLQKYKGAPPIHLDTTHLKPYRPYYLHKMMRGARFVFNIGMNRKVPFIQKGEAKKDVTFSETKRRLWKLMLRIIKESDLFEHKNLSEYLQRVNAYIYKAGWKFMKREWRNIEILFKLAIAERRFSSSISEYKQWLDSYKNEIL